MRRTRHVSRIGGENHGYQTGRCQKCEVSQNKNDYLVDIGRLTYTSHIKIGIQHTY